MTSGFIQNHDRISVTPFSIIISWKYWWKYHLLSYLTSYQPSYLQYLPSSHLNLFLLSHIFTSPPSDPVKTKASSLPSKTSTQVIGEEWPGYLAITLRTHHKHGLISPSSISSYLWPADLNIPQKQLPFPSSTPKLGVVFEGRNVVYRLSMDITEGHNVQNTFGIIHWLSKRVPKSDGFVLGAAETIGTIQSPLHRIHSPRMTN